MQVHGPSRILEDDKEVHARLNGKFVDLGIGHVHLYIDTPEECDWLIRAAVEAKGLLLPKNEAGGWCPAFTEFEDEGVTAYCDRKAGHPGSHHAPGPDEGSEVAWSDGPGPASPGAGEPTVRSLAAEREMRIRLGYDRQAHLAWFEKAHPDVPEFPGKPRTEAATLAAVAAYSAGILAESIAAGSPVLVTDDGEAPAPAYMLACGHQLIGGAAHVIGAEMFCDEHGETRITATVPLSAEVPA